MREASSEQIFFPFSISPLRFNRGTWLLLISYFFFSPFFHYYSSPMHANPLAGKVGPGLIPHQVGPEHPHRRLLTPARDVSTLCLPISPSHHDLFLIKKQQKIEKKKDSLTSTAKHFCFRHYFISVASCTGSAWTENLEGRERTLKTRIMKKGG